MIGSQTERIRWSALRSSNWRLHGLTASVEIQRALRPYLSWRLQSRSRQPGSRATPPCRYTVLAEGKHAELSPAAAAAAAAGAVMTNVAFRWRCGCLLALLVLMTLSWDARAWDEPDTVQVCNRNDVTIQVAYGVWSPALVESSRSWRRGGWWTIQPRQCAAVVDLEDYDGDVGVMLAVLADGVPTRPGRSYTGGVKQCVTTEPFQLRGGSSQGATSCPAGQRLEAFPYWELIRWSDWRNVTLGARRPKIDVVIGKVMNSESEPDAAQLQAKLQTQRELPKRSADLGPHFACIIDRVKRKYLQGDAGRVVNVERINCAKEVDSLCYGFRRPKSPKFEEGVYLYERSTDKWYDITAIDPESGRFEIHLSWPLKDRDDVDSVDAEMTGACRWVK